MAIKKPGGGKKKRPEEHEKDNAERWLLTYADMITLLMLFFIVLWSMSQVDKKKYDEIAQVFQTVFSGSTFGQFPQSSNGLGAQGINGQGNFQREPIKAKQSKRNALVLNLESRLKNYMQPNQLKVIEVENGLKISFFGDLYFAPGSAEVPPEMVGTISDVSSAIRSFWEGSTYSALSGTGKKEFSEIRIEGHTDATAVGPGSAYRNNWELSSARALKVLELMADFGVDEKLMSAVAYGENRPQMEEGKDSSSPEAMAWNRRVDVILQWDDSKDWIRP